MTPDQNKLVQSSFTAATPSSPHPSVGSELSADQEKLEAQNFKTGHIVSADEIRSLIAELVDVQSAAKNIAKVAKQMNFVALNATIEAVRGGDASAGFQQVSNTIGDLAKQATGAVSSVEKSISQLSSIAKNLLNVIEGHNYEGSNDDIGQEVVNFSAKIETLNLELKRIKDTAADTSLVALNAGIGADRAGISGKGFGVVATETKSLSNQMALATNTISQAVVHLEQNADKLTAGIGCGPST